MTQALPRLTDAEVRHSVPPDEEAGFGCLQTERGRLPLRSLEVQARVDGLLAETALTQTFVNPFPEPLEATYIFPLPDRAAVTRFRLEVAGRVVEGQVKERGAARREYQQALRAGHRAAISEEERPGVFTLRVGNLPPGEKAVVRLSLVGPLTYSDGETTYRFPLVVAPRYIPGEPLPGPSVGDGTAPDTDAVPDASRITPPVLLPGYPHPVRLALTVEIMPGGLPVHDLRSSLHAVTDGEDRTGRRRVTVQPGERLDRDFILRFRVGEKAVKTALTLRPDSEGGSEGTFLLTVLPPAEVGYATRPRDVVFVLDRSGSMEGWKMVAARRALARMVDTLTEADRFTVYAFDTEIETPREFGGPGLVPASDRNRFRAVEFLARIESRGGTELAQPLDRAVKQLTSPDRDQIIVLVTDGQVGNEDQILRGLAHRLTNIRIFTLGIDQAVNEAFLKRLALLGGGSCELVESEDRLDEVMDKVHRRIGSPVLTGLRLEPVGMQIEPQTLVPGRLPDLFAGAPVMVLGRYRGNGREGAVLRARDGAGRDWSEELPATVQGAAALAPIWARGHIRELEDRFVTGRGDRNELEKRIVSTSLRFGVLSRFTAFVAVDWTEVVNKGGEVHQITQPVEAPAGWGTMEPCARALNACASVPAEDTESVDSCLCEFNDTDIDVAGFASTHPAPCAPQPAPAPPPAPVRGRVPPPTPAVRSPAPTSADKQGLRGKIFRRKATPPPVPAPPPAGPDFSAYRKRAQELLRILKSNKETDLHLRLGTLGIIAEKLAALVEDMRSVGVPDIEVQPLDKLVGEIRTLMGKKSPDEIEVAQLWSRAEDVLRAFSGEAANEAPAAGPGDRKEGFWK